VERVAGIDDRHCPTCGASHMEILDWEVGNDRLQAAIDCCMKTTAAQMGRRLHIIFYRHSLYCLVGWQRRCRVQDLKLKHLPTEGIVSFYEYINLQKASDIAMDLTHEFVLRRFFRNELLRTINSTRTVSRLMAPQKRLQSCVQSCSTHAVSP